MYINLWKVQVLTNGMPVKMYIKHWNVIIKSSLNDVLDKKNSIYIKKLQKLFLKTSVATNVQIYEKCFDRLQSKVIAQTLSTFDTSFTILRVKTSEYFHLKYNIV